MRITRTRSLAALVATAIAGALALSPVAASAQGNTNGAPSALNTIAATHAGLIANAVQSVTDADSAAQTAVADIPVNPTIGVNIRASGGEIVTVGLPDASHLSEGVKTHSGVVVYHNTNGSDVVAVPTIDGVQFLTTILNATAPTSYAYPMAQTQGGTIQIGSDGSALVLDSTGKPISVIAVPWAYSAKGEVPTSFTSDGKTLTQHILHQTAGVSYPVVADPNYAVYPDGVVVTYNKWDTGVIGASSAFTAVWIAAAALSGQGGNKLYHSIWYIQAVAAYDGAIGQCLWVWVPVSDVRSVSAGGYAC